MIVISPDKVELFQTHLHPPKRRWRGLPLLWWGNNSSTKRMVGKGGEGEGGERDTVPIVPAFPSSSAGWLGCNHRPPPSVATPYCVPPPLNKKEGTTGRSPPLFIASDPPPTIFISMTRKREEKAQFWRKFLLINYSLLLLLLVRLQL